MLPVSYTRPVSGTPSTAIASHPSPLRLTVDATRDTMAISLVLRLRKVEPLAAEPAEPQDLAWAASSPVSINSWLLRSHLWLNKGSEICEAALPLNQVKGRNKPCFVAGLATHDKLLRASWPAVPRCQLRSLPSSGSHISLLGLHVHNHAFPAELCPYGVPLLCRSPSSLPGWSMTSCSSSLSSSLC